MRHWLSSLSLAVKWYVVLKSVFGVFFTWSLKAFSSKRHCRGSFPNLANSVPDLQKKGDDPLVLVAQALKLKVSLCWYDIRNILKPVVLWSIFSAVTQRCGSILQFSLALIALLCLNKINIHYSQLQFPGLFILALRTKSHKTPTSA